MTDVVSAPRAERSSVSLKRLVLTSRVGESEAMTPVLFAIEPSGLP